MAGLRVGQAFGVFLLLGLEVGRFRQRNGSQVVLFVISVLIVTSKN